MSSIAKSNINPLYKPLRLGFAAFVVGLCGVALGFAIGYGPHNPWSFIVFGVVALAVAIGFISIVWGWVTMYRHNKTGRS